MNPRIQHEHMDPLGPAIRTEAEIKVARLFVALDAAIARAVNPPISKGTIHRGDPGPFSEPQAPETDFARRMRTETLPDHWERALETAYDWGRDYQRKEDAANGNSAAQAPAGFAQHGGTDVSWMVDGRPCQCRACTERWLRQEAVAKVLGDRP